MSFIPDEGLSKTGIQLAPMLDFLFLILMFFACLAATHTTTKDLHIDLVEVKDNKTIQASNYDPSMKIINININATGEYSWCSDQEKYSTPSASDLAAELKSQCEMGILSYDKTKVLLKIDRETKWEPIFKAIFAIQDTGFDVYPIYEPIREEI